MHLAGQALPDADRGCERVCGDTANNSAVGRVWRQVFQLCLTEPDHNFCLLRLKEALRLGLAIIYVALQRR